MTAVLQPWKQPERKMERQTALEGMNSFKKERKADDMRGGHRANQEFMQPLVIDTESRAKS